jgi:flagellum-specific ATP synthase
MIRRIRSPTPRAILDGHILLSRRVADSGLYPAIDVESSVSRVVTEIADEPWRLRIRKLEATGLGLLGQP